MANYAFLDHDNIVIEVIGGRDDLEGSNQWELHYANLREQTCKRTSYNTRGGKHYTNGTISSDQSKSYRKNYATVGFTYDSDRDAFIAPKPYDSWTLNETSCTWEPPVEYPTGMDLYGWEESTLTWVVIIKK